MNNWRYIYETRQGSLDCGLGITTSFDCSNQCGLDSLFGNSGSWSTQDSRYQQTRLAFSSPLEADMRRFILGDAFLGAGGLFQYNYNELTEDFANDQRKVAAADSVGWSLIFDERTELGRNYTTRRIDFRGEIRLGWGRVYKGKYAATAISIVDELSRSGLLSRSPDRMDMLELTKLVHAYREGHGPDKREFRINALKAIVTTLHHQGVIADESAASLLRVEDVLDYFTTADRSFGWSAQVGFGGHDIYYNNQQYRTFQEWTTEYRMNPDSGWIADTLATTYESTETSVRGRNFTPTDYVIVSLEYHRPLAARWQFDLDAWSRFYFEPSLLLGSRQSPVGFAYVNSLDRRSTYTRALVQYFYDARTTFLLAGAWIDSTRTDIYRFNGPGLEEWKVRNWQLQLLIGADYRFSPATSLSLDFNYRRLGDRLEGTYVTEQGQRTFSVSAGITHWLF